MNFLDYLFQTRTNSLLERIIENDRKIQRLLQHLIEDMNTMSAELESLQAQVAANTAVEESAVALIKGLADQISALKEDPAALQALADSLHASAGDLSAAVAANTAAPEPAPAEEPAPAPAEEPAPEEAPAEEPAPEAPAE